MLLNLIIPRLNLPKTLPTANIVTQKYPLSLPIVSLRNSLILLLPSRIPKLNLDLALVYFEYFREEIHAYGSLGVFTKIVSQKPQEQVGLANPRISQNDHFGEQIKRINILLHFLYKIQKESLA